MQSGGDEALAALETGCLKVKTQMLRIVFVALASMEKGRSGQFVTSDHQKIEGYERTPYVALERR